MSFLWASVTLTHNAIDADVEIDGLCANIVAFAARREKVSRWRAAWQEPFYSIESASAASRRTKDVEHTRERAIFASISLLRMCVCALSAGVSIQSSKVNYCLAKGQRIRVRKGWQNRFADFRRGVERNKLLLMELAADGRRWVESCKSADFMHRLTFPWLLSLHPPTTRGNRKYGNWRGSPFKLSTSFCIQ